MIALKDMHCQPVRKGTNPIRGIDLSRYCKGLDQAWELSGDTQISRIFEFKDFRKSMAFAIEVAMIAEKENHHPDMNISYARVILTLSTHDIGGLSLNDFILASKIESIL